jgi:hypothetical protein
MNRRKFLKITGLGAIGAGCAGVVAVVASKLPGVNNRPYYGRFHKRYRFAEPVDNGVNHMSEVGEGWEPAVQIGTDSEPPTFEWFRPNDTVYFDGRRIRNGGSKWL